MHKNFFNFFFEGRLKTRTREKLLPLVLVNLTYPTLPLWGVVGPGSGGDQRVHTIDSGQIRGNIAASTELFVEPLALS